MQGVAWAEIPRYLGRPWEHRAMLLRHDESWRVSHVAHSPPQPSCLCRLYSRRGTTAQSLYYGYWCFSLAHHGEIGWLSGIQSEWILPSASGRTTSSSHRDDMKSDPLQSRQHHLADLAWAVVLSSALPPQLSTPRRQTRPPSRLKSRRHHFRLLEPLSATDSSSSLRA